MRVEVSYEYYTNSRGWEWKHGAYAYETNLNLRVGDVVVVPTYWDDEVLAVVVSLSASYEGKVRRITRRATAQEASGRPAYQPK